MNADKSEVKRIQADADERASRGWKLRVMGATWDAVARDLGMSSPAAAYRCVKNFFGSVPQPDRDMLREIARQRGERLWLRAAAELEKNPSPAMIRAAVAVLDRAARLDGLDAPTRTEYVPPTDDEFSRVLAAAARGLGMKLPVEADIFSDEFVYAEVVEAEA